MKNLFLFVLPVVLMSFDRTPPAQSWAIAEGYQIRFSGSGAEGNFYGLSGTIQFDPENLAGSSFNVKLDPSTIDTGSPTKDKHARGDSWFDVEAFPEITFVSSEVRVAGTTYMAEGTLTMHGIEKSFSLPFTFTPKGDGGLFEGYFIVDRTDFQILGPVFGFLVDEKFEVNVTVPVSKV
ncbi:MAG: YceI family protein [Leptolyngbya sp. SIO3F4]|nr:YceI family protein [Leptolyngbya sp. SIO3F4]